jgi:hypothetical protein
MRQNKEQSDKISIDRVKELMEIILPIPRWWMICIVIVFLFSSFEIRRSDNGLFTGTFRISGVGITLFALMWLPVLLKLIGLSGIGLKTSGVEASTGGLLDLLKALDPSAQRETLPPVIAALEVAETEGGGAKQPTTQRLRQQLQDQLASLPTIPKDAQQARAELNNYAREYERIRHDMPSGSARTIRLSALVSRIMALAEQAKLKPEELKEKFESGKEGDRIVALAISRVLPDPRNFEMVAEGIDKSKSPFDQYQALRAVEEMFPLLDAKQKQQLEKVLTRQRSGLEGTFINRSDMSRWNLSGSLLDALRAESKSQIR